MSNMCTLSQLSPAQLATGTFACSVCSLESDSDMLWSVNPGFGGQGFIQSQISKIARLRQMCNELGVDPWIEVDGGIGPGNAAEVSYAVQLAMLFTLARFGALHCLLTDHAYMLPNVHHHFIGMAAA